MSLSDRFISRPVLTSVCSVVILVLGLVSYGSLPIDFLPDISQPQIQVTATYPGGNASLVELAVTDVLEDVLSDTPGVDYISSTSSASSSTVTLRLLPETSADTASLDVQNRIQAGKQNLPKITQDQGITITQTTDTRISGYLVTSSQGQYDSAFITSLIKDQLQKPLQLIDGVGKIEINPERPRFQINLNPELLASYQVDVSDVQEQIIAQNSPASGGTVGAVFIGDQASYAYPVLIENSGFIKTVEEFEDLIVRTSPSGSILRIKDIGTVSYLADPSSSIISSNGYPGSYIAINLKSGGNAVRVAEDVDQLISRFKSTAPPGIRVIQFQNRKGFILDSIGNVRDALGLAIVLVVLILLLFLQDWRTIVIPGLAIPISIVGTFAFLGFFDFSLNFLTMTGLVLATGLVVDDAILVVEAVSTKIRQGVPPRQAAVASMNELFGAIISTSIVLIALFLPVALIVGPIGKIYLQFAVTIISAIAISTFNAITFSPMLAALILKQGQTSSLPAWQSSVAGAAVGVLLGVFTKSIFGVVSLPISVALFALLGCFLDQVFAAFNRFYRALESRYESLLRLALLSRVWIIWGLFPLALGIVMMFRFVPQTLIPQEDMNNLSGPYLLNPGSSIVRVAEVGDQARQLLNEEKALTDSGLSDFVVVNVPGGTGFIYLNLEPLNVRVKASQMINAVSATMVEKLSALPTVYPTILYQEPMIPGFGERAAVDFNLIDQSGGRYSINEFFALSQQFQADVLKQPAVQSINTTYSPNAPAYQIEINRSMLGSLDLDYFDAVATIQGLAGGSRVVQTALDTGPKDVYLISEPRGRLTIDALMNYGVKNKYGDMVYVKQFADARLLASPSSVDHFNFQRSISFNVMPAGGYSTGDAMDALKRVYASSGLTGVGYEFINLARIQNESGGQTLFLFSMAAFAVFLVLSALYESYITSMTIVITIPLAVFGSLLFLMARSMSINIFAQIGLLMLIGLAAKNAILVVEASDQRVAEGLQPLEAALSAAKARLQPILMTSFASLAGFFPLVVAQNAGSNTQQSIGTVVFGGLLMGTALSLLVVPSVYVVIKNCESRWFSAKT